MEDNNLDRMADRAFNRMKELGMSERDLENVDLGVLSIIRPWQNEASVLNNHVDPLDMTVDQEVADLESALCSVKWILEHDGSIYDLHARVKTRLEGLHNLIERILASEGDTEPSCEHQENS